MQETLVTDRVTVTATVTKETEDQNLILTNITMASTEEVSMLMVSHVAFVCLLDNVKGWYPLNLLVVADDLFGCQMGFN